MSFRNSFFRPVPPKSEVVTERVLSHSIVNDVDIVTAVDVDAASLSSSLPNFDDYKISNLLAAGAPLNTVDPVLFHDVDSEVSSVLDDYGVTTDSNVNDNSNN